MKYTLYRLEGGKVAHTVDLDCADEVQADDAARGLSDDAVVQLWREGRLVRQFAPKTVAPPAPARPFLRRAWSRLSRMLMQASLVVPLEPVVDVAVALA